LVSMAYHYSGRHFYGTSHFQLSVPIRAHPWLNSFRKFCRHTHPLGDLGSLAYSFMVNPFAEFKLMLRVAAAGRTGWSVFDIPGRHPRVT